MIKYGITVCLLVAGLLAGDLIYSQSPGAVITIQKLPVNAEEFTELRNRIATTPEGGAAMFMVAFMTYVNDNDLGLQFMTLSLDMSNLSEGNVYKGYRPARSLDYHLNRMKLPERKHVPFAYVVGAKNENRYEVTPPFQFQFSRNRYSEIAEDRIKVFIQCAGASMPRPVTMKKNSNGIWKVQEASSLFLDVMAPPSSVRDDL